MESFLIERMTKAIVLWRIKAGQVTRPFLIAESVMYSDARVKAQFATNMHTVSARVKAEYWIVMVNARGLTCTISGPSTASYVNWFMTPASREEEETVKPLGEPGTENWAISTDRLSAGLIASANNLNV